LFIFFRRFSILFLLFAAEGSIIFLSGKFDEGGNAYTKASGISSFFEGIQKKKFMEETQ
jgi:hypothetical protein